MTTKIKSGVISDNAITSAHISSGAISSSHLTGIDTDAVSEGSSNLYFTTTRARTSLSVTDSGGDGSLTYDNSTGAITYTGPSAAEVRAHISVTDSGGDGSLAYSNGVITYTGPSASEVRAHLSAGTGVTYSSGEFSIGQSVATTASPTFADINITGDLNITGDINSYSVTDLDIVDQTITLGVGQSESASGGSGIVVDGSGASILWDEANDEWDFNKPIVSNRVNTNTVNNVGNTANIIYRSSTNTIVGNNASALVVQDGGNVGIGQASPDTTLHIGDGASHFVRIENASSGDVSSGYQIYRGASTVGAQLYDNPADNATTLSAAGKFNIITGGSGIDFHVDTSGNVGIGVIPSAWDGSMTALQLDTGSIYVNNAGGTYIGANFYYDTTSNTNKYIENNYAAAYGLSNGRHEFYVAGSGTAGNDVSFTEAMRIHSNGKVGIGSDVVSGPVMGLHVGNGTGVLFGPSGSSGSTYISPDHENTINGNYGMDTDAADLWVNYRGYQNGTSRFRNFKVGQGKEDLIAVFEGSSSNVGIGIPNGTSPTAKLHVGGAIKGTDLIAHDSDGLAFQTDEGTKRISILDSGAVVVGDNSLIGTNPTGSALNIFGDGVTLRLDGSGNSTKTILFRGTTAGNPGEIYADGGLRFRTEDSGMPITFYTNSTGTNNERMRIDGNDGSVRFKVGGGDTGDSTTNTGSVSMSNTDIDADTTYTHKSGRYLTSNGTGWETGADGKNAALVIHNDTSQTDNRNWPGIIMHNENNTTSAYGPFIGWGARSPSGQYNTTYAWIMGRPTGTGNDSNWRAGELELYTQHPGGYVGQKPGIRITSDGLVQQPKLYDSNGFFWARNPNQSNQSATTGVIFGTRQQAGSGNFSTTTGRYTTPVDGVYQFNAQVRIDGADASSSGHYMRMAFYTGTSPTAIQNGMSQGHVIHGPGMISSNYFSMSSSWAVYLSAGTQVGVAVLANTGTYDIHGESSFSGFLVG